MSDIICFEKLNGEKIITEVLERGKTFHTLKNPMAIYPSPDGTKIGFMPCLYAKGTEMDAKIYTHSISMEHVPDVDIVNAYIEYVKRLTSSIIQLDKSIAKVQLNG